MKLSQLSVSLLYFAIAAVSQIRPVSSAKILAVYAFPGEQQCFTVMQLSHFNSEILVNKCLGKSHYMMHTALIRELIENGHQVTMIAAFSLESQQLGSNYTELLIEPVYDFWHDGKQ